ncbi:hypothetical protein TNCV_2898831 [Trichonephila clavipes]|nr:hypothetical protein TNCV_2898831 [Trichonephila clavipes]
MLWGGKVAGRNYPPTNKNTLIRALTEEWDKLPQQLLDNVVQTPPPPTTLAISQFQEKEWRIESSIQSPVKFNLPQLTYSRSEKSSITSDVAEAVTVTTPLCSFEYTNQEAPSQSRPLHCNAQIYFNMG